MNRKTWPSLAVQTAPRTALALCLILATAVTLLGVPRGADAQFVDEDPVGRLTIGGTLGVVTSSMSDVNANLSAVNNFLVRNEGIRSLDKVNTSTLSALDLRYKLFDNFSLGFAWGALNARSEFSTSRVNARFYSRVTTYTAFGLYHFPGVTEWNERIQIYAGPGVVFLRNGHVEWGVEDFSTNNFIDGNPPDEEGNALPGREPPFYGDMRELSGKGIASGSGTGFQFIIGSSYQLSGRFSVAGDLGYRLGKLSDLQINADDVTGIIERPDAGGDPNRPDEREPGDWAIWDFFYRDPDADTPDGRNRRDPRVSGQTQTGCSGCPLYYTGGGLEVDYSGLIAQLSFRIHF